MEKEREQRRGETGGGKGKEKLYQQCCVDFEVCFFLLFKHFFYISIIYIENVLWSNYC